jgi:hypothetical protein
MRLGFTYPQLLPRRDEAIDRRFTHWSFYKTPIFGGNSTRRRQLFFFGSSLLLAGYAATVGKAAALQQRDAQFFASMPLVFGEDRGQADPQAIGEGRLGATSNYFRGNDRSHWMTGIANYRQVKYHPLYPGIDILYYGNQRQLQARRAPSVTFSAARQLRLGRDSLRRRRQTR